MDMIAVILLIAWSLIDSGYGSQFELYHKTSAMWEDAGDHCVLNERRFAKVDSAMSQKWLNNLAPYVSVFFWIGLKRDTNSDQFVWTDTSPASYTNWAQGQPVADQGADCVRIRPHDFAWEAFNCSADLPYLCENLGYVNSMVVSSHTKIKGVLMGLGVIGGLLLLCCLLLQLPCCRMSVSEKIAQIGFGTKGPDTRAMI